MALPSREFSDVFERWVSLLDSVDVRVAARRVRDKGRETEHWRIVAAAIRISSRPLEVIRCRHSELAKRFGPPPTRNFTVRLAALPVTAVPSSPERLIVQPLIDDTGGITLGLYTGRGPTTDLVRWRRLVERWDADSSAAFEFLYQLPENAQHIDDLFAMERSGGPIQETERLISAYLQLRPDAAPRGSNVFVELQSPARLCDVVVSGTSVKVVAEAPDEAAPMQAIADRLDPRTASLLQRLRIGMASAASEPPRLEGRAAFEELRDEDSVSCILENREFGEFDVVHEAVPKLRHVAEQNPLLTLVSRFWNLGEMLDTPLLQPGTVAPAREPRTPQRAFQAAVGHLLTLAGIPTIDLGAHDKLYAPGTKVELGTADLLGFHAPTRLVVIGACTMNVPRPQDADALLNVAARLGEVVPPDSGLRLFPVLFSDQRGESATRSVLEEHGVRLVVHDDLEHLRALVAVGDQRAILIYLRGGLVDQ